MQIGVETSRAVETKRVFVIDTDEITRAALQFMLHDENETHEIAGVEEAFARATERKPDLVLLGGAILRQEGMGALAAIRATLPGTRILLVVDGAADPLGQAGLAAGAHGVLAKPLTVEGVRRHVDAQLGRLKPMAIPLQVMSGPAPGRAR